MRSLISCLAAVLLCAAVTALASPASAGLFGRRAGDLEQPVNGQPAGGQCGDGQRDNGQCAGGPCAGGQCDNGQGTEKECERGGKHRRPIDVNVDVSPTPIKINVSPTPVTIQNPAAKQQEEKPSVKPDLGMAAVAVAVAAIFGIGLLGALAAGFHTRAGSKHPKR